MIQDKNHLAIFVSRADSDGIYPTFGSNGPDPRELEEKLAVLARVEKRTNYLECKSCGIMVDEDIEPLPNRTRHSQNPIYSGSILCVECMIKNADNGGKEVIDNSTKPYRLLPPQVPTRAMMESIPPLTLPPPISGSYFGSVSSSSSLSTPSPSDDEEGGSGFLKPKLQVIIPTREEQIASELQANEQWAREIREWNLQVRLSNMGYDFNRMGYQSTSAPTTSQEHCTRSENDTATQDEYAFDSVRSPKPTSVNKAVGGDEDFEEYEYENTDENVSLVSRFIKFSQWILAMVDLFSDDEGEDAGH